MKRRRIRLRYSREQAADPLFPDAGEPGCWATTEVEPEPALDPFGGRFVVHGGKFRTMEGSWGRYGLILIEFPTTSGPSPGTTRPSTGTSSNLRNRHMTADVIVAEGVPAGHRAAKRLAAPEASGPRPARCRRRWRRRTARRRRWRPDATPPARTVRTPPVSGCAPLATRQAPDPGASWCVAPGRPAGVDPPGRPPR
ncbi:DUF1330 domain-containing protein [Kitasatospora sp. NPDC004622]|uniref:DUF1330 domain-containing protein n=1 Tax=Kitasatospora sp. NPDC004622 TaxID=3364018 RepID=UPI0036A2C660